MATTYTLQNDGAVLAVEATVDAQGKASERRWTLQAWQLAACARDQGFLDAVNATAPAEVKAAVRDAIAIADALKK